MGDPIQNLGQINLQGHPALEDFLLRIYADRHALPPLSEILVTNSRPNDGIIDLSYIDEANSRMYVARLNAGFVAPHATTAGPENVVSFNIGTLDARGRPTWQHHTAPTEVVPLACSTVHALGGNREDGFSCHDLPLSTILDGQRNTAITAGLGWWGSLEVGSRLLRRGSFTRALVSGLRPIGTSELTASQRWWQTSPGVTLGFGAMILSNPISDALGLTRRGHPHERWALAVGMGHGTNLLTNYLSSRLALGVDRSVGPLLSDRLAYETLPVPVGRPRSLSTSSIEVINPALPAEAQTFSRTRLRPMSLASGLLSSALVDATLGRYFEEGSPERFALRTTGFFLPQIFRSFIGERALAFSERRGVAGVTRWGGRAVVALFAADALYMGVNYLSSGSVESGRRNTLYAHANEIQRRHQDWFSAFFDGVAESLAPSLAQRFLVGDEYVNVARREFENQSTVVGARASSALRQFLLFNPLGDDRDPEFYRHIDWSLFRGPNRMANVRRADGRLLPVADVYEQISDPAVYSARIENATPAEQIRYIRDQFRGHHLSEGDVREILGRIAVYRLRDEIAQLHYIDTPEHQPLLRFFDVNGSLRADREGDLLAHVFPEIDQGENQILALRRVSLVNHIHQLEGAGRTAEAARYITVARELGLRDESGAWATTGEAHDVVEHGLALSASHPLDLPPPVPATRTPTDAELIRFIMPRLGSANHAG